MSEKYYRGVVLHDFEELKEGEWVYGLAVWEDNHNYILSRGRRVPIVDRSFDEFTDLTDCNGTKIFEGDIVRFIAGFKHKWIDTSKTYWIVQVRRGLCGGAENLELFRDDCSYVPPLKDVKKGKKLEVIGNLRKNPELMD